ncbi:MAG: restriction endonuclease subunit S [bacterium]
MAAKVQVETIPLSKTTKFIVDNRGRTAPTAKYGIPLIATNCISNNRLYPSYENLRFVSKETYENWFRSHPQPGDIILTNKGSQNGAICLVPDPVDFVIAQDMVALRANEKVIDPLFLFASLRSADVQREIKNLDVSGVIPHFKKTDFDKLHLPYPARGVQEAIGRIYFDFSAKIELNRRMNATLEATARALFQSWFVDFDPVRAKLDGRQPSGMDAATAALFPDSFKQSSLGHIPNGWSVKPLSELVEVVKGRSYSSEELADSKTALVTLKSFLRGGGYRADGLKPFTGDYKPNQRVTAGDLIVAFTDVTQAADVIGKPALVRSDERFETLVASLDVGIVRPKAEGVSTTFLYCLFLTEAFQSHTYAHSTGTTVLHLSPAAIPSFECAIPNMELATEFERSAEPLFKLIDENAKQSRTLTALRDTLLPKLLSGELSVSVLENAERKDVR